MPDMEIGDDTDTSAGQYWAEAFQHRISFLDQDIVDSATAQNRLDTEAAAIQRSLVLLNRRRNALSPIMHFPSDIFSLIFAFHKKLEPHIPTPRFIAHGEREFVEDMVPQTLGWIKATHVAHFWREVALANPILWSDVTFGLGPEWTQELLRRSGSCPILLDIWHPRQSCTDMIQAFVDTVMHRVHTVQISNLTVGIGRDQGVEASNHIYHASFPHAPILTTLRGQSAFWDERDWLKTIFGHSALPRLRDIAFYGHPSIDLSAHGMFTHLALHTNVNLHDFPTISSVLQRVPQLESLTLHGSLDDPGYSMGRHTPTPQVQQPQVRLLSLRHFDLKGTLDLALPYIVGIEWHRKATLTFDLQFSGSHQTLTCIPTLRERMNGLIMRALRMRSYHLAFDGVIEEIACWELEEDIMCAAPDFSFRMRQGTDVHDLCRMVCLDHLRVVDVSLDRDGSQETEAYVYTRWRDTFAASHQVVHLAAHGSEALREVVLALHVPGRKSDFDMNGDDVVPEHTGSHAPLFSALETLTLTGCKGWDSGNFTRQRCQTMLCNAVKLRSRSPGTLKVLRLEARVLRLRSKAHLQLDDDVYDERRRVVRIFKLAPYVALGAVSDEEEDQT